MNGLENFKKRFDPVLKKFLDQKLKDSSKHIKNKSILNYIKHLNKITLSSGKRIRPYLAFLMYESLGGNEGEKAIKLFIFLEIFHAFCLTHDDFMDESELRHGQATSHTYILEMYKKEKRKGNLEHNANSQAILLGDLQLIWSNEILNLNADFDPNIIQLVKTYFYDMANEVSFGQMMDIDVLTKEEVTKEEIDKKTYLKTAGYSFIKPLLIGAALSGKMDKKTETFCINFGTSMGIAFQMQDDLLSITSSSKKLGKPTSSDKHTYFTDPSLIEEGKRIISNNFEQARRLINNFSINKGGEEEFLTLVDLIQQRAS